jgi:hypothetical protein
MNDPAAKRQALMRRSHEHTMREARSNPEKLADSLGGTPKAQAKWNVRSSKKAGSQKSP